MADKKIVCLGGGIGTVNLIRGLKYYTSEICVVSSMADDGGSSGRLRRLYDVPPPGDLVSCMAAIGNKNIEFSSHLLTYRFPGNRYGNDSALEGHKLGNLILTSIFNQTNDFIKSIEIFQRTFNIPGHFYPSTLENITISIKTKTGKIVVGEEKIELGQYRGKKDIDKVFLHPKNAKAYLPIIDAMINADAIIVGPGDVYTNNIPVLIVEGIHNAFKQSKARKFLVVNIANKPQETKDYAVSDYFDAFEKHLGNFPFDTVLINNNYSVNIPKRYKYEYVRQFGHPRQKGFKLIRKDLLDEVFPLYHDCAKLAKAVVENI